jgi:hypothetical protein
MNAVFEAEKALGRMPKDVSSQRGLDDDIESIDADGAGERGGRSILTTGGCERCGLGPAGLRRHPDHQEPATAAGRREGTAWTTGARLTSESDSGRPKP